MVAKLFCETDAESGALRYDLWLLGLLVQGSTPPVPPCEVNFNSRRGRVIMILPGLLYFLHSGSFPARDFGCHRRPMK